MKDKSKTKAEPERELGKMRQRLAELEVLESERKRGEEVLRETNVALAKAMPGISRLDPEGRYEYVNEAYARMIGYTMGEMIGMDWSPTLHPDDRKNATTAYQRMLSEGQGEFEARAVRKDGSMFHKQVLMVKRVDSDGNFIGHHCFMRNITERKQVEEALRQSEERFNLAISGASDGLWDRDILTGEEWWSPRFYELLGYEESEIEVTCTKFQELLHPEDEFEALEAVRAHLEDRIGYDVGIRLLTKSGEYRWFRSRGQALWDEAGKPVRMAGSIQDITKRKRAEEALRDSEARYRALYDDNPSMYFTVHPEGTVLSVNQFGAEQLGYTVDDLVGQSVLQVIYDEDRKAVVQQLAACVRNPAQVAHWEFRKVGKDGRILWVKETVRAVQGADGNTVVLIVCEDVTERRQAEEALEWLRRQNELILTSAGQGIYGLDRKGKTTFVNPAAARMIGWEIEELVGRPMHALLHHSKQDRTPYPAEQCPIYAAFKDGAVRQVDNEVFWRKDGTSFPVEYTSTPIRDERGELVGAVVTFKDITERKKADQQIIDYQGRLRALTLEVALAEERERRRIATGLHDDIGQILATAKLKLGELQQSEPSGEGSRLLQEIRDLIDKTIRDSRSLTFELSSPILYTLGLEAALRHLGKQLERRDGIRCHFETDNQPKPLGNEASVVLYRTVRELVHNVEKHAHARQVKMAVARFGDQIHISVEDDGVGFDASRIGQSVMWTGRFGLFSICEQLKQMGGRLEGESVPGQGTRIVVVAPLQ